MSLEQFHHCSRTEEFVHTVSVGDRNPVGRQSNVPEIGKDTLHGDCPSMCHSRCTHNCNSPHCVDVGIFCCRGTFVPNVLSPRIKHKCLRVYFLLLLVPSSGKTNRITTLNFETQDVHSNLPAFSRIADTL